MYVIIQESFGNSVSIMTQIGRVYSEWFEENTESWLEHTRQDVRVQLLSDKEKSNHIPVSLPYNVWSQLEAHDLIDDIKYALYCHKLLL